MLAKDDSSIFVSSVDRGKMKECGKPQVTCIKGRLPDAQASKIL